MLQLAKVGVRLVVGAAETAAGAARLLLDSLIDAWLVFLWRYSLLGCFLLVILEIYEWLLVYLTTAETTKGLLTHWVLVWDVGTLVGVTAHVFVV